MDQKILSQFGEFCFLKKQVMGPDIHQKLAGVGTQEFGDERAWQLAVYNNFASAVSGAIIYSRWTQDQILGITDYDLERWIRDHWAGIPIRQNRRPSRSVPKLTRSLKTLANWMDTEFWNLEGMSYEEAWKSLDYVYTWGRYVKIKFLETARRYLGYEQLVAPSIMAAGGWSPRKALALIYPEYAAVVANKSRNDKRTLAHVYSVADEVRAYISENYVSVSNYELEALLCNYRQALSTRKAMYVGRTIDSELEMHRKVKEYWGDPYLGKFNFFDARLKTFPVHTLGEHMGWTGVRKDLSNVLTQDGYIWSDVKFCYTRSQEDLAHPVRWEEIA